MASARKRHGWRVMAWWMAAGLFGCVTTDDSVGNSDTTDTASEGNAPIDDTPDDRVIDDEVVDIALGDEVVVTPADAAVTVGHQLLTISAGSAYRLHGVWTEGRVVVDAGDERVQMILDGATIESSEGAPLWVASADKVVLMLAESSDNTLREHESSPGLGDDGPNAAVYSQADLTVWGQGDGSGRLLVDGGREDGLTGKDDLLIDGAQLSVVAADDGIRGKDALVVRAATIDVIAGGDGLKSDNDEDPMKGYIQIDSGSVDVEANGDGLAAATDVVIGGGDLVVVSGGGAGGALGTGESAKGLKAGVFVAVAGGTLSVDSADDALHADEMVVIDNGSITLRTGDDAMHAEVAITINGGALGLLQSYEGIEAPAITVNGGDIRLVASDDGVNVVDGERADGSRVAADHFWMNGGRLVMDTGGDGLDANASAVMNGGTLIIHGPTANNNGAIDYDGTFAIHGGLLVAAGSAGMAQAPDGSSTQPSLRISSGSVGGGGGPGGGGPGGGGPGGGASGTSFAAGTLVHVEDASGTSLLTFAPAKAWQSVVFSSPELSSMMTVEVFTGGAADGEASDGLYVDASYTAGTDQGSAVLSTSTTDLSVQ